MKLTKLEWFSYRVDLVRALEGTHDFVIELLELLFGDLLLVALLLLLFVSVDLLEEEHPRRRQQRQGAQQRLLHAQRSTTASTVSAARGTEGEEEGEKEEKEEEEATGFGVKRRWWSKLVISPTRKMLIEKMKVGFFNRIALSRFADSPVHTFAVILTPFM